MKKFLACLLSLCMLFSVCGFSVSAVVFKGDEGYSIEIPEDFKEVDSETTSFIYENEEDDVISISCSEDEQKYAVKKMKKDDIEAYKTASQTSLNAAYSSISAGATANIESVKKEELPSGHYALVMELVTYSVDFQTQKLSTLYQKTYFVCGEKYSYNVSYSSYEKKNLKKLDEVAKTLVISENDYKTPVTASSVIPFVIVFGLVIIGILRFASSGGEIKENKKKPVKEKK